MAAPTAKNVNKPAAASDWFKPLTETAAVDRVDSMRSNGAPNRVRRSPVPAEDLLAPGYTVLLSASIPLR
jgi:hypothetical protein